MGWVPRCKDRESRSSRSGRLDPNLYNLQFDVYLQHRHTFLSVDYPTRKRLKLPDTKIKAWGGGSVFIKS